MIYADENGAMICSEYTPVGVKKNPEEATKELFSILDTMAAEIGNHATNEKDFVEAVLLPLQIKVEAMLEKSLAYKLLVGSDCEKAYEIYDRLSGKT